jgi:hypothetical protein
MHTVGRIVTWDVTPCGMFFLSQVLQTFGTYRTGLSCHVYVMRWDVLLLYPYELCTTYLPHLPSLCLFSRLYKQYNHKMGSYYYRKIPCEYIIYCLKQTSREQINWAACFLIFNAPKKGPKNEIVWSVCGEGGGEGEGGGRGVCFPWRRTLMDAVGIGVQGWKNGQGRSLSRRLSREPGEIYVLKKSLEILEAWVMGRGLRKNGTRVRRRTMLFFISLEKVATIVVYSGIRDYHTAWF